MALIFRCGPPALAGSFASGRTDFCQVCGSVVHRQSNPVEPLCHDCCIWADDLIWGFDTCL